MTEGQWPKDDLVNNILYASEINSTPPIGTILAWLKSFTGTPTLPTNWVECNGQTLSDTDSPFDGETIPDLNGSNNFLRGNSSSGGTGTLAATGSADIPYYNVVWIMKIK